MKQQLDSKGAIEMTLLYYTGKYESIIEWIKYREYDYHMYSFLVLSGAAISFHDRGGDEGAVA